MVEKLNSGGRKTQAVGGGREFQGVPPKTLYLYVHLFNTSHVVLEVESECEYVH